MSEISITDIGQAIHDTLAATVGIARSEFQLTLTESIPDEPLLQVYWDGEEPDFTQTERTTFGGGVRQMRETLIADVFVSQRNILGQDFQRVDQMAQAVSLVLRAQNAPPLFGLVGIASFKWRGQRVTLTYGEVEYSGIRYTIDVWGY